MSRVHLESLPFVPSKGYTKGSPLRRGYDLIVVHTMEAPEKGTTAEAVARYFQTTDRQVSAHFCIDADSIVQCVRLEDVAWCAPGANHNGIHLEHAGYARQSEKEWADPYSEAMLTLSAELTASLALKYRVPLTFVGASALQRGVRGVTTHAAVSQAFKRSDHWDPGPSFPMDEYLELAKTFIRQEADDPKAKPWPVPIPKWFWAWAEWHLQGRKNPRPPIPDGGVPRWAWRRLEALVAGRAINGKDV